MSAADMHIQSAACHGAASRLGPAENGKRAHQVRTGAGGVVHLRFGQAGTFSNGLDIVQSCHRTLPWGGGAAGRTWLLPPAGQSKGPAQEVA